MRCAKVGSRMLCAFCQFGSCVSAVNSASPPSMRTRRSEPRTALSKRFSSHSSATRSAPETTTSGVPIMSSQKIGPCSRVMRIRSWIGAPPSTVSMLPSTGVRGGCGIGCSLLRAMGLGGPPCLAPILPRRAATRKLPAERHWARPILSYSRPTHSPREETVKVGFIGVGNMGGPMCRNIVKRSNHQVTVFDLNAAALKTCTDLGATAAKSVADVTKGADVVMTSLPMPRDVEAVTLGDNGILANIGKGQTYIDLSTNAPSMVKKIGAAMAAKGIAMLDAPVSGGTTGAEAATIAIMVGGDKKVFDDALPVLQSFSANVIHMGALGSGTVAKLVNNMLSFCNMAALVEGMMLGTSAGLDPDKLLHVIANASGNSNAIKNFTLRALPGKYSPPSFALDLAYKDLHLALELGDELGVPLQQGASTHNLQRLAKGMGFGPDDSCSVLRVYETMLGRKVKP